MGGFDENLSYNEDYGFLLKMLSVFEVAVTKSLTMIYTDDNKTLSVRKTPLSVEFGGHLSSLSIENCYINYLLYYHYKYTLERRILMGDYENANSLYKEIKQRFLFPSVLRNKLLNILIRF